MDDHRIGKIGCNHARFVYDMYIGTILLRALAKLCSNVDLSLQLEGWVSG
jgi:hypothetical protein